MSAPFFDLCLALRRGSFDLDYRLASDARCVGVFGPSGAGKTTVAEHVAGWRAGAQGHVRLGGRTLMASGGRSVPPHRRGIGYVPQDVLLFPHWDVLGNVTAARRGGRAVPAAEVDRVLAVLELDGLRQRGVGTLSGGERHRVALARALCSRPELLVLDEPLASLDLRLRRRILADLLRVRDEFRVPMLFISHDATEVQVLCDHVQLLDAGRVTEEGPPAQVLGAGSRAALRPGYENVLTGVVRAVAEHTATVELASGHALVAPRAHLAPGDPVAIGVAADEVLVAVDEPTRISARNVLPATIEALGRDESSVSLTLGLGGDSAHPLRLAVHVTESARSELGLEPGLRVFLLLKTRSLEVIA